MSDVPVLLRRLWELSHALRAMSSSMERAIGVSGPQRLVLREVQRRPGVTPGELAESLCIHPSTVTGLVDRLVARELLHRRRRTDDRRSSRLRITPAGEALLESPAATVERVVQDVAGGLEPSEVEAAQRVIADLSAALNRAAEGEAPPNR